MPTRRSKNQNLRGCYSYHERQKDKAQMGYGSHERRLSKDSIKSFDMCCLNLQHAKNPMISTHGILFDRESVLSFIIQQKQKNKRQKRMYDEYIKSLKVDTERDERIKKIREVNQFIKTSDALIMRGADPIDNPLRSTRSAETPKISSNFWMAGTVRADHSARMGYASLTDGKGVLKRQLEQGDGTLSGTGQGGALRNVVEKPDKFVKCPITGKQLEFSQLIPIQFKRTDGGKDNSKIKGKETSSIAGQASVQSKSDFCCAISGDPISNSMKLVAIIAPGETEGKVCSEAAYINSVKKTMICPFTNKKIDDSNVISMKRGGTGFASTNDLQRTEKKAAHQAS